MWKNVPVELVESLDKLQVWDPVMGDGRMASRLKRGMLQGFPDLRLGSVGYKPKKIPCLYK